jgi:hypothetical protein
MTCHYLQQRKCTENAISSYPSGQSRGLHDFYLLYGGTNSISGKKKTLSHSQHDARWTASGMIQRNFIFKWVNKVPNTEILNKPLSIFTR